MTNDVSFKSKINFVNAKTFCNLCYGEKIGHNKFVKAKIFNTTEIRNCTGSIAVDYKKVFKEKVKNLTVLDSQIFPYSLDIV